MNKYLIYIISASVYTIILTISVYNFATTKERNACIARESMYIAKQTKVANEATAKQTNAVTEANNANAMAIKERIAKEQKMAVYKYPKGTENCANVCVDILKKGLE